MLNDLKIIVVEPDPQRARDIIDALKDGGWTDVTMIGAAAQLDRFVRTQNPDIILIDLANPDRDTLEHLSLVSAGISYEIVPGVTAASGASAALGGFLTQRGACDTLVLTTGQTAHPNQTPNWLATLRPGTRVAIYMGLGVAGDIARAVMDTGHAKHIQIDIVANAQARDEIIASCTPDRLVSTLAAHGISNPAILFLTWPAFADGSVRAAAR